MKVAIISRIALICIREEIQNIEQIIENCDYSLNTLSTIILKKEKVKGQKKRRGKNELNAENSLMIHHHLIFTHLASINEIKK